MMTDNQAALPGAGLPHTVVAKTPTIMLLLLLKK